MSRLFAFAFAASLFASTAAAQEPWQDETYTHAYDAYFACYRNVIDNGTQMDRNDASGADDLFRRAYAQCAGERSAGTALAEARLAVLRPDYSTEQRRGAVDIFRRGLVVLGLLPHLRQLGLGSHFERYFQRTQEY